MTLNAGTNSLVDWAWYYVVDPANLILNNATDIDTLYVRGNLYLGRGQAAGGRIGDSQNDWKLPDGINVKVGVAPEGESGPVRGNLTVGYGSGSWSGYGLLQSGNGGSFTAWLNNLEVGRQSGADSKRITIGTLDLSTMTTAMIDAVNVHVGRTDSTAHGQGVIRLGEGHVARLTNVTLGEGTSQSSGNLELNGSDVTIDGTFTLNPTGTLTVDVGDTPSGLTLVETVSPQIATGGRIVINFNEDFSHSAPHWGMRWAGNKAALLGEMLDNGRLQMNINFGWPEEGGNGEDEEETHPLYQPAVFYDDTTGYTYAALIDKDAALPPAVDARDVVLEAFPGAPCELSVNDIYVTIYNPEELEETGRTISSPLYQSGEQVETIIFPTPDPLPGDYEFTITISFDGDVETSDTATVTFVAADPTAGSITWSAGAAPDLRWSRGANWTGGRMPALDSTGTITFTDAGTNPGQATSILNPQTLDPLADTWQIGGLKVMQALETVNHTIDFDGYTLKVMGNIEHTNSVTMNYQGGTLALDPDGTPRNMTIKGTMNMASDMIVDANIGTLALTGTLDLRGGASVADGTLAMANLTVTGGGTTRLRFDSLTDMHTLAITGNCYFADGGNGTAYMGDSSDLLPANFNIDLGVDEVSRGNFRLGNSISWSSGRAFITATSGGSFDAYVTEFEVAHNRHPYDETRSAHGELTIDAMNSVDIDAERMNIGTRDAAAGPKTSARGIVRFGTGNVRVDSLVIGTATFNGGWPFNVNSLGSLTLSGTDFRIDGSLDIGTRGSITVNVGDTSSGLDLAAITPTVHADGRININFNQVPADASGRVYGLIWEGSKESTEDILNALQQAGQLVITIAQEVIDNTTTAQWVIDHDGTYAYVALQVDVPDYSTYAGLLDLRLQLRRARTGIRRLRHRCARHLRNR